MNQGHRGQSAAVLQQAAGVAEHGKSAVGQVCTGGPVEFQQVLVGRMAASRHATDPGEAVTLAATLGRLPERLVVYAVETSGTGFGAYLSPESTPTPTWWPSRSPPRRGP